MSGLNGHLKIYIVLKQTRKRKEKKLESYEDCN